ncbi:barstar family protein [Bacillus sp. Hm123]|uniref:barstar family protein n=1 Tax=Bacillus sp. Hm123 TaxID=3450745 RepID=UPI003F421869
MVSIDFTKLENSAIRILSTSDVQSLEILNNKELKNELNIILIDGGKCVDKWGLFEEFKIKMNFPDYFTDNWDGFDECINDLDWLPNKGFLLVFDNSECILSAQKEELLTFFEIMNATIQEWKDGEQFDDFSSSPVPFNIVMICKDGVKEDLNKCLLEINEDY